jgi:hypothetical protein
LTAAFFVAAFFGAALLAVGFFVAFFFEAAFLPAGPLAVLPEDKSEISAPKGRESDELEVMAFEVKLWGSQQGNSEAPRRRLRRSCHRAKLGASCATGSKDLGKAPGGA